MKKLKGKTTPATKYLKDLRLKAKLSQGDLSKYAGYTTPQFASNVERGISPASPYYIAVLCKMAKATPKQKEKIIKLMAEDFVKAMTSEVADYSRGLK